MKKSINVEGISIAYVEKHPAASHILYFIHGNSGSSGTWEKQLSDPLLEAYHLIAFDLPGHGDSSHSAKPDVDYSPLGTAKILARAIIELSGLKPYILIGFSYGTNLIAEILGHNVTPKGICMIGMCCIGEQCPMENVFKRGEQPSVFFYNEDNREMVYDFIEQCLFDKADAIMLTENYFRTDTRFRLALMQTAANGQLTDEIATLQKYTVPLCMIFGKHDNLINAAYLDDSGLPFWRNKINFIEIAGHFVQLDKPKAVTQILINYANEVFIPQNRALMRK